MQEHRIFLRAVGRAQVLHSVLLTAGGMVMLALGGARAQTAQSAQPLIAPRAG
ncbi:MAG: hypothetical protein WA476_09180 [Acidobacteriaceae bacterium]